ncbi:hypothetical protein GCM10009850_024210 [Nonomuraea monospora]|uniref:Virulence factor Mce-like protein n=1 Tax=Nonomuraea monospora TaxID=568818 RepID=A0ABN3CD21_9ACTN
MRRLAAVLLGWVLVASGCGGGGGGPYLLVAIFSQTPSLYEEARVKVMGLDAGYVDRIQISGDKVRVEMRIDRQVPLPSDVMAVIAPQNTLGERNVVLHPPWKPGDQRVQPGATIPLERTDLPVEIDEALDAFTKLTDALDDEKLGEVAGDLADGVRGRGETINDAIADTSELTGVLAKQDQQLISLAKSLNELATSLNRRESQVTGAIDAFSEASAILADERQRLRGFITSMAAFVRRGDVIIEQYAKELPQATTTLAELVLTVRANSASTARAVKGAADFADVLIDSWDHKQHVLKIRVVLNAMTRAWLTPLFDALNLGPVPCLPAGLSNCPFEQRGGSR